MYYKFHLFHECCSIFCINSQHLSFDTEMLKRQRSWTATKGVLIKKSSGVSAWKSFGSLNMAQIGREFKHPPLSISKVMESSLVNTVDSIKLFNWNLTHFTLDSQMPPECGAAGGFKIHIISSLAMKWLTWSFFLIINQTYTLLLILY